MCGGWAAPAGLLFVGGRKHASTEEEEEEEDEENGLIIIIIITGAKVRMDDGQDGQHERTTTPGPRRE